MHRLMYSSVAVAALNESELDMLLGRSRQNNADADLTGILLHIHSELTDAAYFVQVLEGPKSSIDRIFAKIGVDGLHRDVVVLIDEPVERRAFGNWSMRVQELSIGQLQLSGAGGRRPGCCFSADGQVDAAELADGVDQPEVMSLRDRAMMEGLVSRYV